MKQIDRLVDDGETRTSFIRTAVLKEIERRTPKKDNGEAEPQWKTGGLSLVLRGARCEACPAPKEDQQ